MSAEHMKMSKETIVAASSKRVRNEVNYRLLAGLDEQNEGQQIDEDPSIPALVESNNDTKSDITSKQHDTKVGNGASYANKHIVQIIQRDFSNYDGKVRFVSDGSTLTSESIREEGFNSPILITDTKKPLGMQMPSHLGGLMGLANIVGFALPLSLMDVSNQEEIHGWTMSSMVSYFQRRKILQKECGGGKDSVTKTCAQTLRDEELQVHRVFNQISMEFSRTPLIKKVLSPKIVRDLDWIDIAWSKKRRNNDDYPRVQYYCLTSTAGCYTDFHVDFGGSSVWYHIYSGQKVFLLIPPTPQNVKKYEEWLCSKDQHKTFFADLVDCCYKVTLDHKQTMLLPSSWIHAVYTPQDTIAFGGNFLHSLNIADQLNIHAIESRTQVQHKFRFPFFVETMFYAAANLQQLGSQNKLTKHELDGLPPLIHKLREWLQTPEEDQESKLSVTEAAKEAASSAGFQSASDMIDNLEKLCMSQKPPKEGKLRIKLLTGKNRIMPTPDSPTGVETIAKVTPPHTSIDNQSDDDNNNSTPFQIFVPQNPVFEVKNPRKKKENDDIWLPSKSKKPKKLSYSSSSNTKTQIQPNNLVSSIDNLEKKKATKNLLPLIQDVKKQAPSKYHPKKLTIRKKTSIQISNTNHAKTKKQLASNKLRVSDTNRPGPVHFNTSSKSNPPAKAMSVYARLKKRL